MPLPVLTTADDVRKIVDYLKRKPTGATINEAKAAIERQTLDPRKVTAYQRWGVVAKEGDRLRLTPLGREIARNPTPSHFRTILDSIVPYRSVLEWIYHQKHDVVTNADVAAHWYEHHESDLGTDNENSIKDSAVCFFHLCQAAGLGKLTIGRQGQATRLTIDRRALTGYYEAGPSTPPLSEMGEEAKPAPTEAPSEDGYAETSPVAAASPVVTHAPVQAGPERVRVFITHGKNMDVVGQVQEAIELADMEAVIAEHEETEAVPVPDKVLSSMRSCNAGIVVVIVEEGRKDSNGHYALNENVLIEVGAAFALYGRRVVLLWDKRLDVPSNLQGLYRCEFEGKQLNADAILKLMKAIQRFKKPLASS